MGSVQMNPRTPAVPQSDSSSSTSAATTSPAKSIPPSATLAGGALSGLVSCLLLQPMDLLKTRMQQVRVMDVREASSPLLENNLATHQLKYAKETRTARLIRTARDVVVNDGLLGLWRGTMPTVIRNVPGVALYFYSVTELRAAISRSSIPLLSLPLPAPTCVTNGNVGYERGRVNEASTLARLTTMGNLFTGGFARVAVGFVLCPITVVKARFESSHFSRAEYPNMVTALRQIYASHGTRGLFQGFTATALRDAPYAGIYLAMYETCKYHIGRLVVNARKASTISTDDISMRPSGSQLSSASGVTSVVGVSGLIAGTLATLFTHPFDILKTRLQTNPDFDHRHSKITLRAAAHELVRADGRAAWLDGLGLRCARKAASSAIGWTIFERVRMAWRARSENEHLHAQEQGGSNGDVRVVR